MNHLNKELIKEWVDKAEGDFEAAITLYKSRKKKKLYYIIAFHCHQTIEKHLKALLICNKIDFPKTHDLLKLLELLNEKDTFLMALKNDLKRLVPYAVENRYPGEDIELVELKEAVQIAKRIRSILIKRINEFLS